MRRFVCYSFLSVLLFLSVSCSEKQPTPNSNEIYVDFKNGSPTVVNSPDDLFNYSNYLDTVIYVQLETLDNCLIGDVKDIHLVNDRLLVGADFKSVFVFDLNGKFLSKVSRIGRGPGEYGKLAWFDVNPSNNEISIYDVSSHKILVYSVDGDFIRQFTFEKIPSDFCVLPNGNYLFPKPDRGGKTLADVNTRWRIEPKLNVSEDVRIHAQIDVFDNLIFGATPDGVFGPNEKHLFSVANRS